jgi:hypothetical protein
MTDKRNLINSDVPVKQPATQKAQVRRDHWFDNQLNELFNQVMSEPLPADLAALVQQLKLGDRQN